MEIEIGQNLKDILDTGLIVIISGIVFRGVVSLFSLIVRSNRK